MDCPTLEKMHSQHQYSFDSSEQLFRDCEMVEETCIQKVYRAVILLWWKFKEKIKQKNDGSLLNAVLATPNSNSPAPVIIVYGELNIIGQGVFGTVYQCRLCKTNEMVAVKTVWCNRNYQFRELQILKELNHCNIIKLKYYFYTKSTDQQGIFINLILEFLPQNLSQIIQLHKKPIPHTFIKVCIYQMFRGLGYLHSLGICHRDIKPKNILANAETGLLKLGDMGSAKHLTTNSTNASYICSRYYRAPELIFGNKQYTTKIDIWSGGCVLGEMFTKKPIFEGGSGIGQLLTIFWNLGAPTTQELIEITGEYTKFDFIHEIPSRDQNNILKLFKVKREPPPSALDLLDSLLAYAASERLPAFQVCGHAFFNELRSQSVCLPNGKELPQLFNFTKHELDIEPSLNILLNQLRDSTEKKNKYNNKSINV